MRCLEILFLSRIILTHDMQAQIDALSEGISLDNLRVFYKEEFGIDDAHQVIGESFISFEGHKRIIIATDRFNHYAQNALLKVLEEPPSGVEFILLGRNKNGFLPTILSRMIIEDKRERLEILPFSIELREMGLKEIYEFLKKAREFSVQEARDQIQSLLYAIKKADLKLSEYELDFFNEALRAQASYQRLEYVFLPLLLMVLQKVRR